MKYNAPYGSADPNAGYVDRNTPGAIAGSRVPAAALEDPQREIMAVINAAGIEPSDEDLTQLLQAINNLISAATGGSGDSNYVLMTQARVRLPIFPEVMTSDGTLPVTSPSTGNVRVPAGYSFLHRGIFNVTTVQADFTTVANKVYHLRWSSASGFVLKDTADPVYNPGGLPETNASFDSSYDDMLVAKVVTNLSNVATITNLTNKDRLWFSARETGAGSVALAGSREFSATRSFNWARTPKFNSISGSIAAASVSPAGAMEGAANFIQPPTVSRYSVAATIATDWADAASLASVTAYLDFNLGA